MNMINARDGDGGESGGEGGVDAVNGGEEEEEGEGVNSISVNAASSSQRTSPNVSIYYESVPPSPPSPSSSPSLLASRRHHHIYEVGQVSKSVAERNTHEMQWEKLGTAEALSSKKSSPVSIQRKLQRSKTTSLNRWSSNTAQRQTTASGQKLAHMYIVDSGEGRYTR